MRYFYRNHCVQQSINFVNYFLFGFYFHKEHLKIFAISSASYAGYILTSRPHFRQGISYLLGIPWLCNFFITWLLASALINLIDEQRLYAFWFNEWRSAIHIRTLKYYYLNKIHRGFIWNFHFHCESFYFLSSKTEPLFILMLFMR